MYTSSTVTYGRDVEGFLDILDKVLSHMTKFNVRLKPGNFYVMTSIEFLGHVFDINGVKLLHSRVQGINHLPEPKSVKGVRSFIGMANYCRDFEKGFSSHMIPLTALTKKRSTSEPFKITHDGQAFSHIKRLLVKSSQLVIMNEEDPLILYIDASNSL